MDVRKGPKEIHYDLTSNSNSNEKIENGAVTTTITSGLLNNKLSTNEKEKESNNMELLKALDSISRIRKGLVAIQIQQLRDRRRLNLFNETNKTNRSEMLIASLAETAVFVLAAIFQIYFVRRWFARRENVIMHNNNQQGNMKLSA